MKQKSIGSTKETLMKTALCLIDEYGGASAVNLREVARRADCSAPNVYNYFVNLDDLLNTVLVEICDDFQRNLRNSISNANTAQDLLVQAFQFYIQYALDFPGRMNFFHFEKLNVKLFSETNQSAISVGQAMTNILEQASEHGLSTSQAAEVCHIIHCYLIGELSEYITGRVEINDKDSYANGLVCDCKKLFEIFNRIS